jgi:hypothetical protein
LIPVDAKESLFSIISIGYLSAQYIPLEMIKPAQTKDKEGRNIFSFGRVKV